MSTSTRPPPRRPHRGQRAPLAAAWLALLTLVLATGRARADLGADVQALSRSWSARARVTRLAPRLFERGADRALPLPPGTAHRERGGCVTVAVLGAPTTSFVVRRLSPPDGETRRSPTPAQSSVAGAVELVRCGDERHGVQQLAVRMRSPRAVLEVLVAQSASPLPRLRSVLPHRDPGPSRPRRDFDPRPRAAPMPDRAERARRRARREGAIEVHASWLGSGYAGAGTSRVMVDPGCHRFHLLGEPTPPGAPRGVDVDLQLVWASSGEVAAVDRSGSVDATVDLCVMRRRGLVLRYVGAAARSRLQLVHARFAYPGGLPADWGERTRSRLAEALHRHHLHHLPGAPVYASLGVTGTTILPVELVPGACYVTAVAAIHGAPLGLGLSVGLPEHAGHAHTDRGAASTALAFCASETDRATLQVSAHGSGVAWILGLWNVGSIPTGEAAR